MENGHAHSRELHIQPSLGRSNSSHDLRAHKEEVELMVVGLVLLHSDRIPETREGRDEGRGEY